MDADNVARIEKEIEDERRAAEAKKQLRQELFNTASEFGNVLFDLGSAQRERELSEIQNNYQARIAAAEGNKELQEKLTRELEQEQKRINREAAIADRNQALFNVAMSTAEGIMATVARLGMPLAIPFIAATGALGALQTAAILSRPIPGFFKGTENAPAGLAWVAERGPELLKMNDGSTFLAKEKQLVNFEGGEKVKHAQDTQHLLNSAIYNDIALNGSSAGVENRLDKIFGKLEKLEPVHINFDGLNVNVRHGNSITTYLNKTGRR